MDLIPAHSSGSGRGLRATTAQSLRGLGFAGFVLMFALAIPSLAQNVTRLEGTVKDASGAVVPQAEIICVGETTGFRFTAETGLDGRYFVTVPEGRYDIVVRRSGFRRVARIGV